MLNLRCILRVTLILGFQCGVAFAQTPSGCSEKQVAALNKAIDAWIKPATNEKSDSILSLACKAWPSQPGLTIISVIFEPAIPRDESSPGAGDGTKEWVTLVAKKDSSKFLALHRGQIEVDAAVRIHSNSLAIDTAAYRVAPGIMAFGIRKNIGYSPNCADGGVDTFFTLFLYDQGKLRPVLGEPHLRFWAIDFAQGHHPCGPKPADYLLAEGGTILKMLKTSSSGFFDIELQSTVTTSWQKSEGLVARYPPHTAKVTARYVGSQYVVPDWFAHTEAIEGTALRKAHTERVTRN